MIIIEASKEKTIKTRMIRGVKHFIDPDIMYKLGRYKGTDARVRFTENYLKEKKFINIAPEIDFTYAIKWSGFFSFERIAYYEKMWKLLFPKNIWTTKAYTGCSEYRYMTEERARAFIEELHDKYPSCEHGPEYGPFKLYFARFKRKKTEYDDE